MNLSANALSIPRRWVLFVSLALALSLLLSACGFKLKQAHPFPFNTLYTNVAENTPFGSQLRRLLVANSPGLQLVSTAEDSEVQLIQIAFTRHKRELSLDPRGQVENYELYLQLHFTVTDNQGTELIPPTVLSTTREIPNSPDASHATEMEIDTLFNHMELSLVDRLIRRLSSTEVTQAFEQSQASAQAQPTPPAQPPAAASSF